MRQPSLMTVASFYSILFYLILPYSTLFYPFLSSHLISLPLAKIVKKGINIVLGVKKV